MKKSERITIRISTVTLRALETKAKTQSKHKTQLARQIIERALRETV